MSNAFTTTLLLAAVSCIIQGLGYLIPRLTRVCGVICLIWLAVSLPLMFFLDISSEYVMLFYLLSALAGLAFNVRGRPE